MGFLPLQVSMAGPSEHDPEEGVLPIQVTMAGTPEHAPEKGVLPLQVTMAGSLDPSSVKGVPRTGFLAHSNRFLISNWFGFGQLIAM